MVYKIKVEKLKFPKDNFMLEMEGEGLRDTETKRDEQRSREGERL